jgi:hypothetical protein
MYLAVLPLSQMADSKSPALSDDKTDVQKLQDAIIVHTSIRAENAKFEKRVSDLEDLVLSIISSNDEGLLKPFEELKLTRAAWRNFQDTHNELFVKLTEEIVRLIVLTGKDDLCPAQYIKRKVARCKETTAGKDRTCDVAVAVAVACGPGCITPKPTS